jgi:competence protein ComGC
MREEKRFSYIEVVIIAIVLGLVGMTTFPKFIEANEESRTGELIDGLQMVRAQLALYHVQHGDRYPPTQSFDDFKNALTTRVGQCGPYIRKIPVNPYNGLDTVRFDGEPAGASQAGWRFDTKTGLFQADNNAAAGTCERRDGWEPMPIMFAFSRWVCLAEVITEGGAAFRWYGVW